MDIGKKIRKYRKAAGLTQEQVAGYLGVSAPAVNKWERGSNYPDISVLPALARLFHTDLNELLSFREELTELEVNVFAEEISDRGMDGDVEGAFSMAEEKIREYPGCELLLYTSATILNALVIMWVPEKEQREIYDRQIEEWLNRAAQGTQENVRILAVHMLALRYMRMEDYEKAEELLGKIPDGDIDKVLPLTTILCHQQDADAAAVFLEGKILQAVSRVQSYLYRLQQLEEQTGNHQRADQIAGITEEMVGVFDLWPYGAVVPHLLLALERKDAPEYLRRLRQVLCEARKPWNMGRSPLYCRIPKKDATRDVGKRYIHALLSEIRQMKEDEFPRGNKELEELLKEYEE